MARNISKESLTQKIEKVEKAISRNREQYEKLTANDGEEILVMDEKRNAELDKKIEILQNKVIEKHQEYNSLAEELSVLLDERYPERKIERVKESLYEAYVKSGRALDEIINLIQDADEYI